ncbi:MAG TPA: family 16 glycoside hydrolase [Puia sp.]|nr:family 16 glycoside hydrolase [Puia sp.]
MHSKNFFLIVPLFFSASCFAQNEKVMKLSLAKMLNEKRITVFNRNASISNDSNYKNGIHLDAKENYGVAWLNEVNFDNGILEFDIKGKDAMQRSFVGIAFHASDNNTMDAIYFRPFNFLSQDTGRKNHSVQYISLPDYDWQRLRTEFPNKYEHSLNPSPKPDEWFHVRIVVTTPKISVYVNNNPNPDLVVEQISKKKEGMIGFWTGNQSDGDFANLKISLQ